MTMRANMRKNMPIQMPTAPIAPSASAPVANTVNTAAAIAPVAAPVPTAVVAAPPAAVIAPAIVPVPAK